MQNLKEIDKLIRQKDYSTAWEKLDALPRKAKGVVIRKSKILVLQEKYLDCLYYLKTMPELSSTIPFHLTKAICNEHLGSKDNAIQDYKKVLKINPEHVPTLMKLSRHDLELNNHVECERRLNLVSKIESENINSYKLKLRLYNKTHEMGKLESTAKVLHEKDPNNLKAILTIFELRLFKDGDTEAAKTILDKARNSHATSEEFLNAEILLLAEMNSDQAAEKYTEYQKAYPKSDLQLHPDSKLNNRSEQEKIGWFIPDTLESVVSDFNAALFENGEIEDAEKIIDRARKHHSNSQEFLSAEILLLVELNSDQAAEKFTEFQNAFPNATLPIHPNSNLKYRSAQEKIGWFVPDPIETVLSDFNTALFEEEEIEDAEKILERARKHHAEAEEFLSAEILLLVEMNSDEAAEKFSEFQKAFPNATLPIHPNSNLKYRSAQEKIGWFIPDPIETVVNDFNTALFENDEIEEAENILKRARRHHAETEEFLSAEILLLVELNSDEAAEKFTEFQKAFPNATLPIHPNSNLKYQSVQEKIGWFVEDDSESTDTEESTSSDTAEASAINETEEAPIVEESHSVVDSEESPMVVSEETAAISEEE